jgi:methylmalonyl-CoA mutase N-terminal domain/subunit
VANTIDPLGGSYFVEALTDSLEAAAHDYFAKIDELGGMVEAVKRGFPQREIADAAFEFQTRLEAGEFTQVGVNEFLEGDNEPLEILRIDPALERKQIGRVQAVRARRDGEAVERELAELRAVAADERRNLMPNLLACARVHATEGEIVLALQDVFGTYTETPVF